MKVMTRVERPSDERSNASLRAWFENSTPEPAEESPAELAAAMTRTRDKIRGLTEVQSYQTVTTAMLHRDLKEFTS